MIELTPQQVAEFDQAYAESVDMLTNLVASYMALAAESKADGCPDQIIIMALADTLARHWMQAQLVSALTAAVVMIGEHTVNKIHEGSGD